MSKTPHARVRHFVFLLGLPLVLPAFAACKQPADEPVDPQKIIEERVQQVRVDLRSLAVGTEAYFIDWKDYPEFVVNSNSGLPTYRFQGGLTTPIAYLTQYSTDPFSPRPDFVFVYWKMAKGQPDPSGKLVGDEVRRPCWITVSAGPDGDYDLAGEWDVFNSVEDARVRLLTGTNKKGSSYTYDPTNGTISDGDIWRGSYSESLR